MAQSDNPFQPNMEMVAFFKAKGKYEVEEIVNNLKKLKCDVCNVLPKKIVVFSVNYEGRKVFVQTCAHGTCGALLVGREIFDQAIFDNMAVVGEGLHEFSKASDVSTGEKNTLRTLVESVNYWAAETKTAPRGIVLNICKFFHDKGRLSDAQQGILRKFVAECKAKAMPGRR